MVRLENVLKISLQDVLKMSWRRLQNVLKTSWRCLEDVFARRLEDVLKTSWRRLEDVLKTSWRRLEDIWPRRIYWSWLRRLEDVFKASWRRLLKMKTKEIFKTPWSGRIRTNVWWVILKNIKMTSIEAIMLTFMPTINIFFCYDTFGSCHPE